VIIYIYTLSFGGERMKKFLTIMFFAMLVFLTSYALYSVYLLKTENNDLNEKLNTFANIKNDTSVNEIDYYKKLSTRAIGLLNEDQLIELAQKEWKYTLYINDKEFTGQSINISGNQIVIKLSENREERSALPEELRLKGQIPGYFYKQINIDSKVLPEITNVDEKYTTSVIYIFNSLETGSKIKITLSNDLKNRLGLRYNNYSINVR
jgi:hypothetical protein